MRFKKIQKYPKYYTVKEWKRFDQWAERIDGQDYTVQEIILQDYDVILTDWKSKREKTIENLNKIERGAGLVLKNFFEFAEALNKPTKKKRKSTTKKRRARKRNGI